jgi:hypothetical protein
MKTQIVVHLLPQEIDWFEWQSKQFKQGSYYLEEDEEIIIDVTLNLNLVNWKESKIPKEFFINKFNQLRQYWDWAEVLFAIDEEGKCLGCDDKRRDSIRTTTADNILYLDCDLVFKPETLKHIVNAGKATTLQYYIISPQIVRLWDSSWDALVNENYLSDPPGQGYKEKDPFEVVALATGEVELSRIGEFKFGGGWFNLLSTKLLKLIDIPDSFGPYGVDDTFVMMCSSIMTSKGYNIHQYVLKEVMVAENIKYRCNPYNEFLSLINRQDEFRKVAESNLNSEMRKFAENLKPAQK